MDFSSRFGQLERREDGERDGKEWEIWKETAVDSEREEPER